MSFGSLKEFSVLGQLLLGQIINTSILKQNSTHTKSQCPQPQEILFKEHSNHIYL